MINPSSLCVLSIKRGGNPEVRLLPKVELLCELLCPRVFGKTRCLRSSVGLSPESLPKLERAKNREGLYSLCTLRTEAVRNAQRLYGNAQPLCAVYGTCTRCTDLVSPARVRYGGYRTCGPRTEPEPGVGTNLSLLLSTIPRFPEAPPQSSALPTPSGKLPTPHPPNWAIPPKSATMADGLRVISANTAHSNKEHTFP